MQDQACQVLCYEGVRCLKWVYTNSLHISVTLCTLPHYISFQKLMSLHSTDVPIFVCDWFWVRNTNKTQTCTAAQSVGSCIMKELLRITVESPNKVHCGFILRCFKSSWPVRMTRLRWCWRAGLLFGVFSVKNGSAMPSSHPLGRQFCSGEVSDPFQGFSCTDWPSEFRNLRFRS